MREPWVAYVVVGLVTFFMLLGKKMIFFSDDKNKNENEKKETKKDGKSK
ncbi:MAG: hypothetical protein WBF48_00560 [Halarcobacter sp.]